METKEQFDSYLSSFIEDLTNYNLYRNADGIKEHLKLAKLITGEDFDEDINEDRLDERLIEHFDALEINIYTDENWWEKIIDVLLAFGWPNIRLRLETRRDSAELDYYRGGDHFTYKNFTREETNMLFSLYNIC